MPKMPSRARGLGAASPSWISPEELTALLEVMARYDATEITQTQGDGNERIRLTVRRGAAGSSTSGATLSSALATSIAHAASMPSPALHHAPPPAAVAVSEEGIVYVTSPLVGTFYRAPSPDTPIFVDVGTRIRPGQRLCIVEAMKLMNEIEAELEGTILEILVENGKPVEYGQKLFKVKKG